MTEAPGTVVRQSVLHDSDPGPERQVLFAVEFDDGDLTLVTQDAVFPGPPGVHEHTVVVQREGVLTTRADFLEWVASTFNVAVYDVGVETTLVDDLFGARITQVLIEPEDVGYHQKAVNAHD